MNKLSLLVAVVLAVVFSAIDVAPCQAQDAGIYPYVVTRPQDRHWMESTPVQHRPYRPLHIYGNRVRRIFHGDPITSYPVPKVVLRAPIAIMRRIR